MAVIAPKRTIGTNRLVTISWGTMTNGTDTGGSAYIGDLENVVIQQISGGAATLQLRGSQDNSNFVNIGSALAANTLTPLTTIPYYIDFATPGTAACSAILTGTKRNG